MTTVAEAFVQHLVEAKIETVFGLPGGENVQVVEALRRAGIRFVLVRNESSALFMADATARLTGKPGVALTTLGPGATNAVAGVAHAYLDRTPVLLITAETPDHLLAYHTHQVVDLAALFSPITKGTFQLRADNVADLTPHALALTQAGRPGPVHLRLSNEEAAQPAHPISQSPNLSISQSPNLPISPANQPPPRPSDLAAARDLLARAQRPVIVAGVGLEPEGPYGALRELAEAANAPVIVTPKAKGALPDDHPLAAGVIGLMRTDPAYEILDEADAIVAVGFDVVELVKPWQQPQSLVWVAPWPNADPTLAAAAELVGPLAPTLHQLADSHFAGAAEWGETRVAQLRDTLAAQSLPEPAAGRLRPQQVLQALRRVAPHELAVATDVGSHKILAGLTWPALAPNRYLLSNGLSCMGYALPAAIAASLALDRQPVVALTGDAGLSMVLGELALLNELDVPVVVVVFNDSALDLIRSAQVRAQKMAYGTEFTNPDFLQIAAAYGLDAVRVTDEPACAAALQRALAAGRPSLIDALIDPVSYATTPRVVGG
jgi:acetolactate synthase I/II/III large subunit